MSNGCGLQPNLFRSAGLEGEALRSGTTPTRSVDTIHRLIKTSSCAAEYFNLQREFSAARGCPPVGQR